MRPPICALCGLDFRSRSEQGELISFAGAERLPAGRVGHPKGLEWFCSRHRDAARRLQHLNVSDALRELRRQYRWRLVFDRWIDRSRARKKRR